MMTGDKERSLESANLQEEEDAQSSDSLDFAPYHDDPEEPETDSGKKRSPLPKDEDLKVPKSRRTIIYKIVISLVTVILCFLIIFTVLSTTRERRNEQQKQKPTTSPRPPPSRDFALNFPEQYPALDSKTSSAECQEAWQALTEIPCHDAIWTLNWDSGVPQLLGPSLDRFVPLICDARCASALEAAKGNIQSACSKEDTFAVEGYKGRFNLELLESGPLDVLDVLVERQIHTCRKSPAGDAERGFCMTDLSSRWGIVDGFRANATQGLRLFLAGTNSRKTEPAGRHRGRQGSGGWSENYNYWREERKFGPGRGETTCSWCTLEWLNGKLPMWKEHMLSLDGKFMSLPEFLRMWEDAGKRCASDRFMEAYHSAVQAYIDQGVLDPDWETKASGDIPYLMQHGPTSGDYPARDVDSILETMKVYRSRTENINPTANARIKHQATVNQYIGCLESFNFAVQDLQCYPFLSKDQMSEYVLCDIHTAQRSCSASCLASIDAFRRKMYSDCPGAFTGHRYSQSLKFVGKDVASFVEDFFGRESTISSFETICRPADNWGSRRGPPCAAVFAQWGRQDWVFQESKPEMKDLIATTRRLVSELPEMPPQLKAWKHPGRKLTVEEEQISKYLITWRKKMEQGVCSDCMWRNFVEKSTWFHGMLPRGTSEDVAIEWIKTAHHLREECAARGRSLQEFELKAVDEMWKKTYSEEAWDKAFNEGQPLPAWATGREELV
ncbi:uncharacterized protein LY89DRAFT_683848 [Mollisia scopiformis]|uniref:Uncharacterized protein n=1 Tax=Mollisia scopiformis TaxID=149040 RepID=A0A194XCF8_MOLSC|nr:uncharacterized protein LY89DRAFT_683848 [Mollisia scopiformis]KUJ17855.1 hypothetical protein LY89DRAFT_683848 [Mollisia scopiformis]